ncbi:hypothetical protein GPLA_3102 [Paraglaciecola polaris LMG 21857]|uniref:Uncharacterized protein n=1 Tax=Paraglaciecola polaris LMG 21857 TaxID=1129793 RepID=K6ZZ32_9ALTE|nr:hypothetical protein GPLA_3102 [Paraglaciecola polaris LMG 21857]
MGMTMLSVHNVRAENASWLQGMKYAQHIKQTLKLILY